MIEFEAFFNAGIQNEGSPFPHSFDFLHAFPQRFKRMHKLASNSMAAPFSHTVVFPIGVSKNLLTCIARRVLGPVRKQIRNIIYQHTLEAYRCRYSSVGRTTITPALQDSCVYRNGCFFAECHNKMTQL